MSCIVSLDQHVDFKNFGEKPHIIEVQRCSKISSHNAWPSGPSRKPKVFPESPPYRHRIEPEGVIDKNIVCMLIVFQEACRRLACQEGYPGVRIKLLQRLQYRQCHYDIAYIGGPDDQYLPDACEGTRLLLRLKRFIGAHKAYPKISEIAMTNLFFLFMIL